MAWLVSDARVLASAEVAESRAARRRGLLKRDEFDGAFVIEPCRSIAETEEYLGSTVVVLRAPR